MNSNVWIGKIPEILGAAWFVTGQMAPWLLMGFLLAGLFSVWISPEWVERGLGRRGWKSSVRAALFGVPLPICSCGVIPLAASLRRHGASRGATAAFLMSTPQTGVDSVSVTWGMLGPGVAVFRPIAAFLSGALCGTLVDRFGSEPPPPPSAPEEATARNGVRAPWPVRALRHGFVVLPRDIHRAVLVGLLLSGLLGALLPSEGLKEYVGQGLGAMALMLLMGIPLYVCATASVPIAAALVHAGVSPGAALVFLIAGPATNAATLSAMIRLLGLRSTAIYLATLVATALLAGGVLDQLFVAMNGQAHCAIHTGGQTATRTVFSLILLAVLAAPFFRRRKAPQ